VSERVTEVQERAAAVLALVFGDDAGLAVHERKIAVSSAAESNASSASISCSIHPRNSRSRANRT
jgi:hypothetical protein